ncbi:MAG: imidazole glycerol phosphate synthase subunit HisH [Lachnospiraceae bacterium]|nr:imidazole glycerol phosphate synthase subunit HisH [Lachnospiraceae bacterium]MCR4685073.1 imidazole glycerol phosphate synthase subunit HisH [Lachnospiraceae bacterium]
MIAIIDYDAGNMKSVEKALHFLGQDVLVTSDAEQILKADHVILPGVGAFGMAMEQLHARNLEDVLHAVVEKGTPFLGVCLGMQLLFDGSDESPGVKGLSFLRGEIRKIPSGEYEKIPHMGWNSLKLTQGSRLFAGIDDDPYVYFVHSYFIHATDRSAVAATTSYNVTIDAAVEQGNLFGCQFHPEKSSAVGLKILENFVNL